MDSAKHNREAQPVVCLKMAQITDILQLLDECSEEGFGAWHECYNDKKLLSEHQINK
jgi:hypothetical protein